MSRFDRRKLLAAMLGWPLSVLPGCARGQLPPTGELKYTNFSAGHQIRDRNRQDGDNREPIALTADLREVPHVPVVIIGGGMAGLSAAWRLRRAGFDDFLVLELEAVAGGTSRGDRSGELAYPWGAHYVPAPMPENRPLIELLREMNVVERVDDEGTVIVGEAYLCRDPQERLFADGQWHEGLYLLHGASKEDLRQFEAFRSEIDRWVSARDESGRRLFAVPMSSGSDSDTVRALDRISMAQWMDQHRWHSARLRWVVDYGCRDDYGLSIDRVSAWAGLFYFAARVPTEGQQSQSVITWPEGNGRIVDHFVHALDERIRCGVAVHKIQTAIAGDSGSKAEVVIQGQETSTGRSVSWRADRVIFAAPQMLAGYLIQGFDRSAARRDHEFSYGSWLVANLHLQDRPTESGFPLSWDNVLYESRSLGYVTSTHQSGIDHGPTVLTWYHPFADDDAHETRRRMLELKWSDWASVVIGDLHKAHPDLHRLVTRLDIMLWGHAMIQPKVGFVWSPAREEAAKPWRSIHFAGADLSGIALFEEALDHGVRAAEEVLSQIGYDHESMLSSPTGSTI